MGNEPGKSSAEKRCGVVEKQHTVSLGFRPGPECLRLQCLYKNRDRNCVVLTNYDYNIGTKVNVISVLVTCHCNKIPDRNSKEGERISAQNLRMPLWQRSHDSSSSSSWSHGFHSQEAER